MNLNKHKKAELIKKFRKLESKQLDLINNNTTTNNNSPLNYYWKYFIF